MESHTQYNQYTSDNEIKNFLLDRTEKEIANWLKKGFKEQDFAPINYFPDVPPPTLYLKSLFEEFDLELQEKLKEAIVLAIHEWTPAAHGLKVLEELSIIAAFTRSLQAINNLIFILKNQWINPNRKEDEQTTEIIMAVLSGFSPSEEIRFFFEDLFFLQDFNPRFAAQLFIGLCQCKPDEYPRYLSKFFEFVYKNPSLYETDIVISKFIKLVSPTRIIEGFSTLSRSNQENLLNWLSILDNELFDKLINMSVQQTLQDRELQEFEDGLTEIRSKHFEEFEQELTKIRNKQLADPSNSFDLKHETLRFSLMFVRKQLNSQIASIFLFAKDGRLHIEGLEGIGIDNKPINIEDWDFDESYDVSRDESFIAKAADVENSLSGKAKSPILLEVEKLLSITKEHYEKKLGFVNSGIAVPLNGNNKTYGVLVVLNKINLENDKRLKTDVFEKQHAEYLYKISKIVSRAISDLRKDRQNKLIADLSHYLVKPFSSDNEYQEIKEVYQKIADRLISDNTSFTACILRKKDGLSGPLKVVAKAISINSRLNLNWNNREDDNIEPDEILSDGGDEKTQEEIIKINDLTFKEFGVNKSWVENNNFRSFGRFYLKSDGKVVGTLSLYTSYDYDFHPSCQAFLKRITDLIAAFISRTERDIIANHLLRNVENTNRDVESTNIDDVCSSTKKISFLEEYLQNLKLILENLKLISTQPVAEHRREVYTTKD